MPGTTLANWIKPDVAKTESYKKLRDAIIQFEKDNRVHLRVDVEYWTDLP